MAAKPQGETIGPGRDIPKKMVNTDIKMFQVIKNAYSVLAQGEVKKKTTGLNKEWRKKYLVLGEETLTYYPSIQVSLFNTIQYNALVFHSCGTALLCIMDASMCTKTMFM